MTHVYQQASKAHSAVMFGQETTPLFRLHFFFTESTMKYFVALFILLAGMPSAVVAQTGEFTWSAPASTNWFSTTNWIGITSGSVPILNKYPGVYSGGGLGNAVNDIATFDLIGPTDIGIAFPGTLSVGAINLASGSRNIGNSGSGSGMLVLNGASSGFGTPAKTLLSVADSGSTLRLRNVASGAGVQTMTVSFGISDGIISVASGGVVAIESEISGGNGFIKSGDGDLRLTGENTFTGLMTINGGSVKVGLGGETGRISGNVQINGGSLEFNNGASAGFSRTYGGDIAGAGAVFHRGTAGPSSESLLQLTGAWTHSGGTTISGGNGVLSIGNGGSLGSITGDISITNASANLRFNKTNTYTYAGKIIGSGGVQQTGSGTTVLSGASSYSGQTIVSNGSFIVNGSLGNTNVFVSSITNSPTLGGSGTIDGEVTMGSNSTLSPGNSFGNLKTGNLSFLDDSTFKFEINSTSGIADRVDVNGDLSLTGDVLLSITDVGSSTSRFSLISYNGDWNGGTFSGLNNGDVFSIGSGQWKIRYDDTMAGDNGGPYLNFVTISAIPEPGSLVMLSILLAVPLIGRVLKRK